MNVERSKQGGIPRVPGSVSICPVEPRTWYPLALIFALVALGIFSGGIISYQNYEQRFRTGMEQQLSAITELKAAQTVQWRQQRLANANYLRRTPYVARRALNVLAQPAALSTRQNFTAVLEGLFASEPYERAILLDERLNVGLVYPERPSGGLRETTRRAAQEALSSRQVVMTDLHRETEDGPVYLSLMVPLVVRRESTRENVPAADRPFSPNDRSAGLLVLQINAHKQLYPLIQHWPTPSQTAESLLVRRDGPDALFLSELKFRTNTALKLRVSLESTNVPAVKAVLGQEGIVEGVDYRGVPVVAYLCAIPNSPWSMVTRMDLAEVYAPLRERLWLTVLLMSALLLGAGASVGLVWRQRGVHYYRERHKAAESLRQEQLFTKSLLDSLPGIFYLYTYPELQLVLWNKQHETLLGFETGEVAGRHVTAWHVPQAKDAVSAAIKEVMEKGQSSIEALLVAKDGRQVPFLLTGVKLEAHGQLYLMGTGIDITERKRVEEQVQQQLDELRRWQAVMLGREDRTMSVKREVNELLGRLGEPIRYPSQKEGIVFSHQSSVVSNQRKP